MNIFKKAVPTVAGALEGFHKAIADLKVVKEHHDAEAAKHDSIIDRSKQEAESIIAKVRAYAAKIEAAARSTEAATVTKAEALKLAAEAEARAAVQAIARVEQFIGL
jgi:uncharacterized protein YccT (UPF0319 family)